MKQITLPITRDEWDVKHAWVHQWKRDYASTDFKFTPLLYSNGKEEFVITAPEIELARFMDAYMQESCQTS